MAEMAEELAPHAILPESWTVKEVVADFKKDMKDHLNKQDEKMEEISNKLDSKADKSDLLALGSRIDKHADRITSLEQHKADTIAQRRFRNRIWAVVGSVSLTVATLVGSLIAAHH